MNLLKEKILKYMIALVFLFVAVAPGKVFADTLDYNIENNGVNMGLRPLPYSKEEQGLYYDIGSKLTLRGYDGSSQEGAFEYFVKNAQGRTMIENTPIEKNSTIDLSVFDNGEYVIGINRTVDGSKAIGYFTMNLTKVNASADLNGSYGIYNPEYLSVGSDVRSAKNHWVIRTKRKTMYDSKSEKSFGEILEELKEKQKAKGGETTYTLYNKVTVKSKHDNRISDKASAQFIIRYPHSTTQIDRKTDPTSVKGTKEIAGSQLSWTIKHDGKVIHRDDGNKVPNTVLNELKAGKYAVYFTEISPENEMHTSHGSFQVTGAMRDHSEPSSKTSDGETLSDSANIPAIAVTQTDEDDGLFAIVIILIIISAAAILYASLIRRRD